LGEVSRATVGFVQGAFGFAQAFAGLGRLISGGDDLFSTCRGLGQRGIGLSKIGL